MDAAARPPRRALAAALALSLALVAAAPFFGLLRDALLATAPRAFLRLLFWGVLAAGAAALALAARRIRERRAARFGALAAAALAAALLAASLASGRLEVDAVERLHVVAYGLLAFLFARGFSGRRDLSTYLLAAVATALAGVVDEWVQWLVPTRVGVARDVALNAASAVPGLLVAWAVRPGPIAPRLAPESRRAICRLAALVVLVFAAFFDGAHLGYRIEAPGLGTFLSWHAPGELPALAAARAERWRTSPPGPLSPLGVEDYYLTEATWRVRERNDALARGDLATAWLENRILEEFYAPVLDLRSPRSGEVHRWPEWKRREVEARRPLPDPLPYASPVLAGRIFPWPGRSTWWPGAAALAVGLVVLGRRAGAASPIS